MRPEAPFEPSFCAHAPKLANAVATRAKSKFFSTHSMLMHWSNYRRRHRVRSHFAAIVECVLPGTQRIDFVGFQLP